MCSRVEIPNHGKFIYFVSGLVSLSKRSESNRLSRKPSRESSGGEENSGTDLAYSWSFIGVSILFEGTE